MQRRAREATPELIGYLLEIARDGGEDARNRIVAITIMLERGWGKVPISEPATLVEDAAKPRLADIVDRWTPEQRALARQLFAVNGETVAEVNAEPAPGSDSSAAAAGE